MTTKNTDLVSNFEATPPVLNNAAELAGVVRTAHGSVELAAGDSTDNDIVMLAQSFIKQFAEKQKAPIKSLHPMAVRKMLDYTWPGNIRELKSMIERAFLISEDSTIHLGHLIFLEGDLNLKEAS